MGKKGYRDDSSLHGFPNAPGSTHWSELLPGPGASPVDLQALHGRVVVLYGRFIQLFFRTALGIHGERLKDVTQEFFAYLLETQAFAGLAKGNFRGFLKVVCRRFYLNLLEAEHADRRDRRREEPVGDRDLADPRSAMPEEQFFALYDQAERKRYLELAMEKVREKLRDDAKEVEIDLMADHVGADGKAPLKYSDLSQKYGLSEDAVRNKLTKVRNLLRSALLRLAEERSKDPAAELRELGLDLYLARSS